MTGAWILSRDTEGRPCAPAPGTAPRDSCSQGTVSAPDVPGVSAETQPRKPGPAVQQPSPSSLSGNQRTSHPLGQQPWSQRADLWAESGRRCCWQAWLSRPVFEWAGRGSESPGHSREMGLEASQVPLAGFGWGFGEGSHRQMLEPCGHFEIRDAAWLISKASSSPGAGSWELHQPRKTTVPLPFTTTQVVYMTNWAYLSSASSPVPVNL